MLKHKPKDTIKSSIFYFTVQLKNLHSNAMIWFELDSVFLKDIWCFETLTLLEKKCYAYIQSGGRSKSFWFLKKLKALQFQLFKSIFHHCSKDSSEKAQPMLSILHVCIPRVSIKKTQFLNFFYMLQFRIVYFHLHEFIS